MSTAPTEVDPNPIYTQTVDFIGDDPLAVMPEPVRAAVKRSRTRQRRVRAVRTVNLPEATS